MTLRTTVMVGFPGETDEDFEALLEFIGEIQFDHLGAFAFSPQKGTPGAELPDTLPDSVKVERLELVGELQRSMVAARNQARVGDRVEVLVDRTADAAIEARMPSQAYEIDGLTYLSASGIELGPGDLALATVTGADDADVWADAEELVRVARAPLAHSEAMGLDLKTAWGR